MKHILLFIFMLCILSCNKHNSPAPIDYTANMGGVRTWHGTMIEPSGHTGISTTTTTINDTFSIIIMDESAIAINTYSILGGYTGPQYGFYGEAYDTLHYFSSNNSAKTYTFIEKYVWGADTIIYNSVSNSMTYHGSWPLFGTYIELATP